MSRWVLVCRICDEEFTQTVVTETKLENHYLPPRPRFPESGLTSRCPHCGFESVYQQRDLQYRKD
jgi:uncharacterized Zn finger protein